MPEINRLDNIAKTAYIAAKKAEIGNEVDDIELYSLYETAYNNYSNLINYLHDSHEAILFASNHAKHSNLLTVSSIGVTIISIAVAIAAWV